jgi:hypothetical protein
MGQIIPFPPKTPAADPDGTTPVDPAESAVLIALRWWASVNRNGEDPARCPLSGSTIETRGPVRTIH